MMNHPPMMMMTLRDGSVERRETESIRSASIENDLGIILMTTRVVVTSLVMNVGEEGKKSVTGEIVATETRAKVERRVAGKRMTKKELLVVRKTEEKAYKYQTQYFNG